MASLLPRLTVTAIVFGMALLVGGGLLEYDLEKHTFRDCAYPSFHVTTWLDENADGIREPEEPPLGNVWVSIPLSDGYDRGGITDEQGIFDSPGALTSCDGPVQNTVAISPPKGYRATTARRIEHVATNYEFGFRTLQRSLNGLPR